MTDIKVLSFDLDDTLWPVAPVIVAAEQALYQWLSMHCPHAVQGHSIESMRKLRLKVIEQWPEKRHDMSFLRHSALAQQLRDAGYPEALADDAFEIFYAARNRVQLYADVEPALRRLQQRYRLFALSNGNADLQRCGVAHFFEGHVNAQTAGVAKPDARIFAQLTRAAGVPARQILHIGDDPHTDVDGAVRSDLHAVWLRRVPMDWPTQLAAPLRIIEGLHELE
jgi:FMN hydrolase / 5-amino-6-(5-phospho-D-ribitylamino)uracil phosphatase